MLATSTEVGNTVPLYVLNYIYDGCELTPGEMALTEHETAQFSVHVVGLVVDRRDETLYVADGAEVLSDAFDRKRRVEKPAQKMEKLKAYVEENGRIPLKGDPRLGFDAYGFWDHCCRGGNQELFSFLCLLMSRPYSPSPDLGADGRLRRA